MTENEGEEVDAEVREDLAHLAVGVHGPVDHLSGNPRQQQRSCQLKGTPLIVSSFCIIDREKRRGKPA